MKKLLTKWNGIDIYKETLDEPPSPPMLILRDESIKQDLAKPWAKRLMTSYLNDALYWLLNGYEITEEQVGQVKRLVDIVEDGAV